MNRLVLPAGVRDPRAATQPLGWTSPGLPTVPEWDADKAFRLGYCANVVAYRCVQIIANAISSVPIVAGADPDRPADINRNSPLARLLGPPPGGPAPRLSARKLIRWTIGQWLVTGRRAWEIELGANDRPVAFWPLVSARLKTHQSTSGSEWFRVFEYGPDQDPKKLTPDQVFYGWDPSGLDFREPESPLQATRFNLSLVTLADRYGMGFLMNNATPATVVTTSAFGSDAERERFRRQWSSEFAGPDNAGRALFNEVGEGDGPVSDAIDVKVLGLSAKDARLVEQRREAMLEVAYALGVPWSKIDASGRTFDNAEVEDRTFWEERLLPLMIDLQDDINMQLAPLFGSDVVWFDLRKVRVLAQRKIDPVTQTVGVPALVQAQIMKINEGRADYGLEPVPDGDRFMTAEEIAALRGTVPADPTPARSAPQPETRSADAPDDQRAETPTEDLAAELEATEARRARQWRAVDATVSTIEQRWVRAMRRLFERQATATVDRLLGKRGRQALTREAIDIGQLFDPEFWQGQTVDVALDLVEQAAGSGVERVAAALGVSFDLELPWFRDFVTTRANQLAGQVTETTYRQITDALAEGTSAGESIEELADRVRRVFSVASSQRSEVIARTEVIGAYNGAAVAGAETLPADVVGGQEWLATRDSRTRDEHAAADGQIVPMGQPFNVAGEDLAYPGDPAGRASNTIQCRCTVLFLTPEEMLARSGRTAARVPTRFARAALSLVRSDTPFDELGFRRALEVVAS